MRRTRHGSLFSGIGGFDLAAAWMGWDNMFQVEISPFCQRVLAYHFPATPKYKDVKKFRGEDYRGAVDILSAGFPCQPFSTAGKRRGKDDDRFLWPETLRLIGEIRPRWIVLENVAGLFSILEPTAFSRMEIKEAELFCKDTARPAGNTVVAIQRRIIGAIVEQIGTAGYILPSLSDGTPVVSCVPACAVGAPHRRDRVWIVAYAGSIEKRSEMGDLAGGRTQSGQRNLGYSPQHSHSPEVDPGGPADAYTDSDRQLGSDSKNEKHLHQTGQHAFDDAQPRNSTPRPATYREYPRPADDYWASWPAESPFCRRDDGLSATLDTISFPKWREESIHSYGNAIVPQAAYEIFQAIEKAETVKTKSQ